MKIDVSVTTIDNAALNLERVVKHTPLEYSKRLSKQFGAEIYLKREDLQEVRSYKIRGAYNLISSLTESQKKNGVVCASAGNHAQGVAFSCNFLKIKGTIFMPIVTPLQKINRVKHFGDGFVEVKLIGANFDESSKLAKEYCEDKKATFIHPFNDLVVISGQGTVGKEIFDELEKDLNFVLCPVGGGGLISGVGTYLKEKNPLVKIIGVEATGAPGMRESLKAGKVITLQKINPFVDGTAVKTVGDLTFEIVSKIVDQILVIDEGQVCSTMIDLYQNEGIVAEPAGALSISALEDIKEKIKDKTVVCVLSGGNNDILRYPEVMERSLAYKGLKHYFLIEFAQKPGQLKKLLEHVLGPTDDIVRFEYIKKSSKETGPALVGIELSKKEDLKPLLEKLSKYEINYTILKSTDALYGYLI